MAFFGDAREKDLLEDRIFLWSSVVLAILLRWALLPFESLDYHNFLSPWYDHLQREGFRGFKTGFSNYTPPYLYLVWLATSLPFSKLYAIKLISVIFDFALAFVVLKIVRLKIDQRPVWLAAFATVLFAPTVFFNSALWGQCDAVYTTFLLAALYCLLREWTARALLFFSIAFAFKLQALFLFPVFFVLWAKGRLPLKYFLLLPLVYLVFCLPAALAGRPLLELIRVYLEQAGTYPRLTSSAPNLYQWLPDNAKMFGRAGLIFAAAMVGFLSYVCIKSKARWGKDVVVRLALASALVVPFSLPYMHERYFYPADCIAIVCGFYFWNRFYVPIAIVMISLFSYFPFLFQDMTVIRLPLLALCLMIVLIRVLVDLFKELYPNPQSAVVRPG